MLNILKIENIYPKHDPYKELVILHTGPILESKGMGAIFQKKGKKMLKGGKKGQNI